MATQALDERFGVILAGFADDGASAESLVNEVLSTMGLSGWYTFSPGTITTVPGTVQLQMARPPASPAWAAGFAAKYPNSYWLLGNEPNVPGQDNIAPDAYATWYHDVVAAILAVDPGARFIAPNGLNWDATCTACAGYPSTHDWSDAFISSYVAMYGEYPRIDVWGMHAYDVDWTAPPLVNASQGFEQIENARIWLDSQPELAGKPIWITEFGVIFGFTNFSIGEVNGQAVVVPAGEWDQAAVDSYMNDTVGWLLTRGTEIGVERWFLFSALPNTEPYQGQSAGLALLRGPSGALVYTNEALIYLSYAGAVPPT